MGVIAAGEDGGNHHNASTSQPKPIANRVNQAIRDPIRHGIDELKKMRNYETRTTYV